MRSVMKYDFGSVPTANIRRSAFDRSHGYKTTFDAGYLVPIYADEALPGDTFNLKMTAFARLATPLHPIMDNLRLSTFFFSIPVRLIWNNWERFNGAQDDPGDSTDYLIPTITAPAGGHLNGSLSDYLGIPTEVASLEHSALWHRSYNLVWNEWFRDQNLQDSVANNIGAGPDASTDYTLLKRGKRHDYFTSCLPWPQKGTEVELPLGSTAPVVGDGNNVFVYNDVDATETRARLLVSGNNIAGAAAPSGDGNMRFSQTSAGLEADLSSATAATINTLRLAVSIQELLERDARGGTRYVEMIKSHFNVTSPDFRMQRPEYLGGGTTMININPVPQTSETGTSPQGNLAATGTALADNHGFNKSFTEHCILLGLVSVSADLTYQQGLDRQFSRSTRYDFYLPSFAHLGEQTVLNKEIYADASANDELVFGYQERWAEYRYKPSKITGQFRSNYSSSLDTWHLSQEFGSLPTLNNTFIEDSPPIDRVVATPSYPDFLFDSHFDLRCVRPMPVYSVPGLGSRF